MIDHIVRFTLPAAYSLLPPQMQSPAASALLLSIGLQESRFRARRQHVGPARGFWQFERGGGVHGVLTHPATAVIAAHVLTELRYEHLLERESKNHDVHAALEDNDVLAAAFARLLLWTVPAALPKPADPVGGWAQYLAGWRPGRPHPGTWHAFFAESWQLVGAP